MSFSHAVFHPAERLDQRLILYTPLPENDTSAKLERLMQGRPQLHELVLPHTPRERRPAVAPTRA
jgi:hypothetical protein